MCLHLKKCPVNFSIGQRRLSNGTEKVPLAAMTKSDGIFPSHTRTHGTDEGRRAGRARFSQQNGSFPHMHQGG